MSRRPKHPWHLLRLAYLAGRCQSYAEVGKVFHVPLRQVEKRAAKEGWYDARMNGDMGGVLQGMIQSVRSEDRDAIAELFKKKSDISLRMAELILGALGKNGKLGKIKSVFGQLELAKVAAKYMDQMQRAVETTARVAVQRDQEPPTPLTINAASGSSVSVQQLIASIRGKGKERIN